MSRCTHHGARRAVLLLAAVFVVLVYLPSVSWADQSMSIITAKLRVFQEYKDEFERRGLEYFYCRVPSST